MKDENIIVQRIKSCFVGEDCVQVMIPYWNQCVIFNSNEIQYLDNKHDSVINLYIDDERKKQFPYNNIPIHHRNKKITLTNQIYEFDKPYLEVRFGLLVECFIVKDGNNALSLTKIFNLTEAKKMTLTKEELEKLVNGRINEDLSNYRHYIICQDGIVCSKFEIKSERAMVEDCLKGIKVNERLYVIDILEHTISCKMLNVTFKGHHDEYEVELYDVPIRNYTYEEIKYLSKDIKEAKEPKIKTRFNKGITKETIEEQKRLVLSKTTSKK